MSYGKIIVHHCSRLGINPQLVAAVIEQESAGRQYAIRYEPEFYRRYLQTKTQDSLGGYWPRLCTAETERRLRAHSFGPMQLMGQTMRERGFKGEFLTELCDPEINIQWGCEFLAHLIEKTGSAEKALLRYNGGGDPKYPAKVFSHMDSGAAHRHLAY